jgi:vacuolar-type H+-ATPase subunit F/Vma7
LGIDEPLFIEVPDAAGYTYEALDGFRFTSIQFEPEVGGNLYLDRQFDVYLMDESTRQWRYHTTISAETPYHFPIGGVSRFQLYGLKLPNEILHRAANENSPTLITTTGLTLIGATGTPVIRVTEQETRQALTTPEDIRQLDCMGIDCQLAQGIDAEFRAVRNGANAEVWIKDAFLNVPATLHEVVQITSATHLTFQGDQHLDRVIWDVSKGPIRLPLIFHGGGTATDRNPKQDELIVAGAGVTLDLTNRDHITGVEHIDLRGSGSNSLIVDARAILGNTDTGSTLVVLAGADDIISIGPGWTRTLAGDM